MRWAGTSLTDGAGGPFPARRLSGREGRGRRAAKIGEQPLFSPIALSAKVEAGFASESTKKQRTIEFSDSIITGKTPPPPKVACPLPARYRARWKAPNALKTPLVSTLPRHVFSRFGFSPYSRPPVAVQRTKGSSLSNGGRLCLGRSTSQCLVARLVRSFSMEPLPLTPSTSSSSGCRFGSWGPCGGPAGGGCSGASRAPSCSFRPRRSSAWLTGAGEALPPERRAAGKPAKPISCLTVAVLVHDCDDDRERSARSNGDCFRQSLSRAPSARFPPRPRTQPFRASRFRLSCGSPANPGRDPRVGCRPSGASWAKPR